MESIFIFAYGLFSELDKVTKHKDILKMNIRKITEMNSNRDLAAGREVMCGPSQQGSLRGYCILCDLLHVSVGEHVHVSSVFVVYIYLFKYMCRPLSNQMCMSNNFT